MGNGRSYLPGPAAYSCLYRRLFAYNWYERSAHYFNNCFAAHTYNMYEDTFAALHTCILTMTHSLTWATAYNVHPFITDLVLLAVRTSLKKRGTGGIAHVSLLWQRWTFMFLFRLWCVHSSSIRLFPSNYLCFFFCMILFSRAAFSCTAVYV